MHQVSSKQPSSTADLRQHFHNYFELMLASERGKLGHAASGIVMEPDRQDVLVEIECRINYLRGAVKMGKLLCLIDQEEARASFALLSSERERLRSVALCKTSGPGEPGMPIDGSSRIDAIRQLLQTNTRSPTKSPSLTSL